MFRAVLLDLYNTLVSGGHDAERDLVSAHMAAQLGVAPQEFVALFRSTTHRRMAGQLGDLPQTLRLLAAELGARPADDQVLRACATRMRYVAIRLTATPDVLDTLAAFRERGWQLGLVSNCAAETPVLWPRQAMAAYFDALGFSSEFGVCKPDPAIYLKVCRDLNVEAADCVFVGDGGSKELPAAAALGMHAIKTVQFGDSDLHWPGAAITHLRDLL